MTSLISFFIYILIGIIFVLAYCRYSDITIQDSTDFSVCVVLVVLWPAVVLCGLILIIMDWFSGFGGGPSLFA